MESKHRIPWTHYMQRNPPQDADDIAVKAIHAIWLPFVQIHYYDIEVTKT